MRLAARVVRWTLSLAFAAAAALCIVRGMARLFGGPDPGQAAAFDGVTPALGYFALGVALLVVAGELFPKPAPEQTVTGPDGPAAAP